MKRIELKMNEQQKYEVIRFLVDHNGNKKAAALKLGCSERNINRLIQKYKTFGKEAFIHGNRGRQPIHAFKDDMISDVPFIYLCSYISKTSLL